MPHLMNLIGLFLAMVIWPMGCDQHTKDLLNYLFDQNRDDAYNSIETPNVNLSHTVVVSSNFYFNQFMKLDEKNEILTTIFWVENKWDDYSLKWDPEQFGGIKALNLPHQDVWKPDITLYNCASGEFGKFHETNVIVNYDGSIIWYPLGLFSSKCGLDISWFPFDEQTCLLEFGLFSHPNNRVRYQLMCKKNTPDCEDMAELNSPIHGEFNVLKTSAKRSLQKLSIFPNLTFDRIIISINFQRRALFYIFNLIFPCLILSFVTIFVFILPPDAGGKISFGVTILLSQMVFLQTVGDILPQESFQFPKIVTYFLVTMLLCALSIAATVLVMAFHLNTEGPVPKLIRIYLNVYVARLVFLRPYRVSVALDESQDDFGYNCNKRELTRSTSKKESKMIQLLRLYRKDLSKIQEKTLLINRKVKEFDEDRKIAKEWIFAGRVVDRFCLIMYTLSTFLMTYSLTVSAPHISRSLQ